MRKIAYKYELLDNKNIHKKWLSNVSSAHIRIVYLTQIKCTGTVTMKDDEDTFCIVRIHMTQESHLAATA